MECSEMPNLKHGVGLLRGQLMLEVIFDGLARPLPALVANVICK